MRRSERRSTLDFNIECLQSCCAKNWCNDLRSVGGYQGSAKKIAPWCVLQDVDVCINAQRSKYHFNNISVDASVVKVNLPGTLPFVPIKAACVGANERREGMCVGLTACCCCQSCCCCYCFCVAPERHSPRQRVVERVERDGRGDALDAEPPDIIVREEAEADLLHSMPNHGPVVRHDDGVCLAGLLNHALVRAGEFVKNRVVGSPLLQSTCSGGAACTDRHGLAVAPWSVWCPWERDLGHRKGINVSIRAPYFLVRGVHPKRRLQYFTNFERQGTGLSRRLITRSATFLHAWMGNLACVIPAKW